MELGFKIYFENKTVYVPISSLKGDVRGDVTVYNTKVDGVDVELIRTAENEGAFFEMNVNSDSALGIRRIDSIVCEVGIPEITDHIAVIGLDTIENEMRFPCEFAEDTEYAETAMGLYSYLDEAGFIVSGVAPFKNICKAVIKKNQNGSFTYAVKTEYTEGMLSYTSLSTERAYVSESITVSSFYEMYRELQPQSTFGMPKLTGWNTWDYYANRVNADDIFENVAALKKMPFADKLNYIVIDDGWVDAWGDWKENEKFACGIKAVADNIRDAGFIPGIWMAPLGVEEKSSLFTEHSEWLCRNEKGEPFKCYGIFYLDPTHPDAHRFILDNYKYQYDAGFRLFKMDYLSALLDVKSFYDKNATPYGILAKLVEDVKAHTGPDAVILGCSLPLECGADIAPSMRLGLDIHNHYPHLYSIARSIAWASVYNNKVTRVDPDFLVVRGEETSNEPVFYEGDKRNEHYAVARAKQTANDRRRLIWRHGDQFNAVEAETWANLVAISGGNIFLSDRMSVLNERGIGIIDNAFKITGDNMVPVYQHSDYRVPSLFKGDNAFVIVNWEDIPRRMTVSGIRREFTSDKTFSANGDTVTVTLLPHESFVGIYK